MLQVLDIEKQEAIFTTKEPRTFFFQFLDSDRMLFVRYSGEDTFFVKTGDEHYFVFDASTQTLIEKKQILEMILKGSEGLDYSRFGCLFFQER